MVGGGVAVTNEQLPHAIESTVSQTVDFDYAAIEKVLIGGNGDPGAQLMFDSLANMGMINPNDHNFLVQYPADIGSSAPSTEIGTRVARDAYYAASARGEHTIMASFSLGGIPLMRVATEIANANGGKLPDDLTVVMYGGSGAKGIFHSSYGKVAEPFLNMAGIDINGEVPAGSHDAASANDAQLK